MYRFEDGSGGCFSASAAWTATTCTAEQPHNNAYGFNFGGVIDKSSTDVVYQRVFQATYSNVSGGLAIAIPHAPGVPYFHDDNVAPVVGFVSRSDHFPRPA